MEKILRAGAAVLRAGADPRPDSARRFFGGASARALAACVLLLLAHAFAAAQSRYAPQPRQQQQQTTARAGVDDEDDEGVGAQSAAEPKEATRVTDPASILRRARFVYVSSDSAFVSAQEIEDSLRKRKEFQAWGMIITRNYGEADLALTVTRKAFTRRFTFTVLDTRTQEVVATGKMRSVLFGKKIPNKIAEQFANRVKVYRPYPPAP